MKKKILIGAFLLLIFITAVLFTVAALDSYNYDMDHANGVDILEGWGAAMLVVVGGFIILGETDLFFTVYYFLVKSKTALKSTLMILSQLLLLAVIFSGDLAKFLSRNVSDFFSEEAIVMVPIFCLYVGLRIICITICFLKKD